MDILLKTVSLEDLDITLNDYQNSDDFFFYFTGHANKTNLGNFSTRLDDLFKSIGIIKGKKLIVLDACTLNFDSKHFNTKDMKVITSDKVYAGRSIALSLYDAVVARKIPLEDLTQETFDSMKHNWVRVKGDLNRG